MVSVPALLEDQYMALSTMMGRVPALDATLMEALPLIPEWVSMLKVLRELAGMEHWTLEAQQGIVVSRFPIDSCEDSIIRSG